MKTVRDSTPQTWQKRIEVSTFLKVKMRSGEISSVKRDRNFTAGKNHNENYMGKL